MLQKTPNDKWVANVQIKGSIDGQAEIYIDGRLVRGVKGYKIEHNSSDKRLPLLTIQVQCNLDMDSGAIPLLPEPWCWFYEPKTSNFVDGHQFSEDCLEDGVK